MSTFVSVGNATQPFTRLLEAVEAVADELPQPVLVQSGHTRFESERCHVVPLLEPDKFLQQIAHADLVIIHAGAGSLIHALQFGKLPVVFPREARYGEHVDDHQVQLAQAFERAGKAILVRDGSQLLAGARAALQGQVTTSSAPPTRLCAAVSDALQAVARQRTDARR